METYSALLLLCAGNSPVTGEFPSKTPVTRSFDVFFYLCLNNRDAGDLRRHRTSYDVTVMHRKYSQQRSNSSPARATSGVSFHYDDVIMTTIASQITSLMVASSFHLMTSSCVTWKAYNRHCRDVCNIVLFWIVLQTHPNSEVDCTCGHFEDLGFQARSQQHMMAIIISLSIVPIITANNDNVYVYIFRVFVSENTPTRLVPFLARGVNRGDCCLPDEEKNRDRWL